VVPGRGPCSGRRALSMLRAGRAAGRSGEDRQCRGAREGRLPSDRCDDSYGSAIKALDIERVIGHYAKEPSSGFLWTGRSPTMTLMFPSESGYRSSERYRRRVRGDNRDGSGPPGGAAASPFREVIIDKAGQRTAIKGTVTWTWVRRGPEWKILYGHAATSWISTPRLSRRSSGRWRPATGRLSSRGHRSILRYYSADLITIAPGEPIRYGNEWIRSAVADLYKAYEFHEDFKFIDIRIIGGRVAASYSFSSQMTPLVGGEKTETTARACAFSNAMK